MSDVTPTNQVRGMVRARVQVRNAQTPPRKENSMTQSATMQKPLGASATAPAADDESIRPFQFHAFDETLADLRRRIAATKWPERETVTDASQGVQLATIQALARYWQTDYD